MLCLCVCEAVSKQKGMEGQKTTSLIQTRRKGHHGGRGRQNLGKRQRGILHKEERPLRPPHHHSHTKRRRRRSALICLLLPLVCLLVAVLSLSSYIPTPYMHTNRGINKGKTTATRATARKRHTHTCTDSRKCHHHEPEASFTFFHRLRRCRNITELSTLSSSSSSWSCIAVSVQPSLLRPLHQEYHHHHPQHYHSQP